MINRKDRQIIFFLSTALLLRTASGPTANISYILIAFYALRGREQALQALFLSWLFSMLNGAFAPEASASAIGRYVLLITASITIMSRRNSALISKDDKSLIIFTLFFGIFIIFHSVLFSSIPDVSILKSISWTVGMVTLIVGWASLNDYERDRMSQQMFVGLALVMLLSLPLITLPSAYIGGVGFMGVLGHTQSFGITMALLGTWVAVRSVVLPNPSWLLISMNLICMVLIFMSGARTAALALLIGVAASMLLGSQLSKQPGQYSFPGLRSRRVQLVILLMLIGIAVAWPRIVEQTNSFIAKGADSSNIGQAYQMSRGALIDEMWVNIENKPWQGVGFGIATIPEMMEVIREPIFNLPTSAIVEKGVLPVAILEELGLVGFFYFVGWIFIILKRCSRKSMSALAVFLVIILLNMGEAILFSSGGMGMLVMMLIAWAATGRSVKKSPPRLW